MDPTIPDVVRLQRPTTAPAGTPSSQPSASLQSATAATSQPTDWENLPLAAFPSYSFDTGKSAGASAELPFKGIPVALGLLGASSASVTVTLSDASSYGLDIASLDRQVRQWADVPENAQLLQRYAARYTAQGGLVIGLIPGGTVYHKQYNYLRIVTRVYFIKSVDVTASNSQQGAFAATGGNPPPFTLLDPKSTTQPTVTLNGGSKSNSADTASKAGGDLLEYGGQIQLSSRSGTSVTMKEAFDRPMVIGYLAYDLPIGEDGRLGLSPVSTQVRLFDVGGLGETTVSQWANSDPLAEQELGEWLSSDRNQQLVHENTDLPIPVTGTQLKAYLVAHAPPNWMYWIPILNDIILLRPEGVLYRTISEDVIRRPPGLRQPLAAGAQGVSVPEPDSQP